MKLKHFKRLRFLLISAIVIVLGLFLLNRSPLSSDIIKILPNDEASRTLTLYNHFESSKKLFIMIPGFEAKSLDKATKIKAILEKLPTVENVFFNITDISPEVQHYLADNYYYLSDFNATVLSNETIRHKLEERAAAILSGTAYVSLDTNDPLGLFSQMQVVSAEMKNGFLVVPKRGYCLIASISPEVSDIEASRVMYRQVKEALGAYKDSIVVFSPNFYGVENSAYIKNDVEKITLFTFVILVLVYFFLLRNKILLLFSVSALVVSVISALILTKLIFPEVSILVIAFGAGIASIAEDYLFLMFINDDYRHRRFNKQVFYGFFATEVGLLSLVWIDFPLIAQLSLFTAFSLAVSYGIFAFVFPRLEFYQDEASLNDTEPYRLLQPLRRVPPIFFLLVSFVMIAYSLPRIVFDPNFRHLDYQNEKLMAAEKLFNETLGGEKIPVLISAHSIEELLLHAEQFRSVVTDSFSIANLSVSAQKEKLRREEIRKFDFPRVCRELNEDEKVAGFRSGTFAKSYEELRDLKPFRMNEQALKAMGIEILHHDKIVSTLGYMQEKDLKKIEGLEGITPIIGRELLSKSANSAAEQLKYFFFLATILLLLIIIFVTRKKAVYAINFLFFPVGLILLMFTLLDGYNIMHLFALFLMMIYGVDYGIYLTKDAKGASLRAVSYSLITTFAGFGILIFSSVPAVYAIGETTVVGLGAMLILLFQNISKEPDVVIHTHS